jgi:hypothetical protein
MSWVSRRIVPYILLGSTLLWLAACSLGGSSTGSGTTPVATTTASAGDATAILNRAQHAPLKDTSFSISVTAGSSNGTVPPNAATVTGSGALTTNPHRTEFDFSSISLFGASTSAEVIIDENQVVYAKVPPLNQWVKVDPNQLKLQIGTLEVLDYTAIKSPVLIGTETINGQATWHVQGVNFAQTNATARRLDDVWIRQSDAYPVKREIHTVPDPTGTPTSDNRVLDLTLQFTKWDTGITITPPTDVVFPPS